MSYLSAYKYLGNYSAVDPAYSRHMMCDACMVSWTGCWDNFQCPQCGEGELPGSELNAPPTTPPAPEHLEDERTR